MWLGLCYFFILFILWVIFLLYFLNILNFYFLTKLNSFYKLNNMLIFTILMIFLLLLFYLYLLFNLSYLNIFNILIKNSFLNFYLFPFIFIFIFITFFSILYCLLYNINESFLFTAFSLFILLIGFNLFVTNYIIIFFFFYEMLLLPSFFILYKFAKTKRAVEAAYLMFFWTQFGAIFLIFAFSYIVLLTNSILFSIIANFSFSTGDVSMLSFFFLIGFGVKLPIWPFYGWLPKAHVEASTNFSIFLSGVLVKFAFFALLKFLLLLTFEPTSIFFIPLLIIGIIDSSFKMFYQIDLKKIVAYSTVIEMHWLTLAIISGYSYLFLAGFCMLVSHAFLSTNFFFLVDCINRRYKTRLITEISSISLFNTKLFLLILLNLIIFLGFPGSLFFIAEFLFFTFLYEFLPVLVPLLLILLYLIVPTLFFKLWWVILCGNSHLLKKKYTLDLSKIEFILILFSSMLLFWLGFSWQLFLFI